MADNKSSEDKKTVSAGTLIITADVSNAIKGLKAIQREAKKATAALKELDGVRTNMAIFDEMHLMCARCGSTNREIIKLTEENGVVLAIKIKCTDCGWEQ